MKLVNGHPTEAHVSIVNQEPEPVSLAFIGGSLWTPTGMPGAPDPPVIVRNLTATRYAADIPAGETASLTYSFATEMHPQDLVLNLAAVLQRADGAFFTKQFYHESVSIVEAPTSIFDPQM